MYLSVGDIRQEKYILVNKLDEESNESGLQSGNIMLQ